MLHELLKKGTRLPSNSCFDEKQVDRVIVNQPSSENELRKFIKKNSGFYYYLGYEGVKIFLFKSKPSFEEVSVLDRTHSGGVGSIRLSDGTVLIVAIDASGNIPMPMNPEDGEDKLVICGS